MESNKSLPISTGLPRKRARTGTTASGTRLEFLEGLNQAIDKARRNARHVGKQDKNACHRFRQSRHPSLQGTRKAAPVVGIKDEGQVEVFEGVLDLCGGMPGDNNNRASARGERRLRDMPDQRLAEKRDDEFGFLAPRLEARGKAGGQNDRGDLTQRRHHPY